jgi:hypothetical protein
MNVAFNLLQNLVNARKTYEGWLPMPHWRQKPKPKNRRDAADVLRDREERRTAAFAACVAEFQASLGPGLVTHRMVAERVGVPVQYVHWRYPSIETLLAVANSPRHGGGR